MRNTFLFSEPGMWFFRVFGYGLHWKNTDKFPLFFSERNGYSGGLIIGKWYFEFLQPDGKGGAS